MRINLKDIAFEVLEVGLYKRMNIPVGLEKYKQIQEIIDKYPEYFPDEHIWKTINPSVHKAYREEIDLLQKEFYPPLIEHIPGEGLLPYNQRLHEAQKGLPEKSLKECVNYMFVEAPKKKKEFDKQKEIIWNKHYKIYGLKYEN